MTGRAFPVIYAADVAAVARFYEHLGFVRQYQFPPEGEAGYVSLDRGGSPLGIVSEEFPRDTMGIERGDRPRFELFVYVDDVDAALDDMGAAGAPVLREAEDMPWGERLAYVADPEGNPVALAAAALGR